ncbi:MAG: hypothetical protein M3Z41_09655 [Candidatus Eremiobacteraeota bacterium]|nr:hypothetical protein [Candidatus Eremiobacteraeota bacterium]
MKPPKRQIIKTRPQRPYVVARIIIVLIVLAFVIAAALMYSSHRHAAHAVPQLVWQEAPYPERMPPIQPTMERRRS